MSLAISGWSLESKLALAALVLGALAVLGDPYGGATVTLRPQELASLVERQADHITVQQLASWIIEGRSDYRLLDLRTPQEYAGYHIPGAENVPLSTLPAAELDRNEKVVLYSEGGIHAAQSWLLLQARGFAASYSLLGGLDEWKESILFPVLPANATPAQRAAFERERQVAVFFGGAPRIASGQEAGAVPLPEAPALSLPQVKPPALTGPVTTAKKKKKEGC